MKNKIYTLTLAALAVISLASSCELLPEETCELDNYCEDKTVTYCCTDDTDCYYTYNGAIYTDDELDDLENDLGCSAKSAIEKNASENTREKLIKLMNRVKDRVRK